MSIQSFRHKGLADLFERGRTRKLGSRFRGASLLILDHLDAITTLQDCVGVRGFHALKGNKKGRYAMVVTGNY
ncbi:MAG TPA: type II toxin-antitoxin system RelE/ParE family toxin, partial [Dongiaceae bacterium]|nr:type II toxin-antitoxin system RelE/ParE family toxin [Dongiaceae bacterium]